MSVWRRDDGSIMSMAERVKSMSNAGELVAALYGPMTIMFWPKPSPSNGHDPSPSPLRMPGSGEHGWN